MLETEELGSPLTHRYHYIRLLPPRHTLHILDIASHLHPSSIVGLFFCTSKQVMGPITRIVHRSVVVRLTAPLA